MSDDKVLRYGFIGTGMMGCEHIRNVRALDGAEVVAIADPFQRSRDDALAAAGAADLRDEDSRGSDLPRANDPRDSGPQGAVGTQGAVGKQDAETQDDAVRGLHGRNANERAAPDHSASRQGAATSPAVFEDYRDMLDQIDLDVVVISTPNHTHVDVLRDVLGRDLHVMVEKPLCTTVDDCRGVLGAAKTHPGLVWMGLEYRYMPAVSEFVRNVESGTIGELKMLFIREHRFPFLQKVGNWNRLSANTGGTLVEKCCHFFDLMNLVVGTRPVRVMASGGQDVNHLDEIYDGRRSDILDNAFVVVDYENGARACLDLCMFAEGSRYEQELVATGDKGKVEALIPGFMEVARGRGSLLVEGSRQEWTALESEVADDDRIAYHGAHHGASFLEHLHLLNAIRTEGKPSVSLEDGMWSVGLGQAAHLSIDEKRPVELFELGLE